MSASRSAHSAIATLISQNMHVVAVGVHVGPPSNAALSFELLHSCPNDASLAAAEGARYHVGDFAVWPLLVGVLDGVFNHDSLVSIGLVGGRLAKLQLHTRYVSLEKVGPLQWICVQTADFTQCWDNE